MEPKPKRNLSTRVLSIGILASLALAGCTTTAPLSYAPPPNLTVERGQGSVAVGQVTDDREKKSTELGVVRGGYGNVLKRIYSDRPVADEVREALQNGLKARAARRDPRRPA